MAAATPNGMTRATTCGSIWAPRRTAGSPGQTPWSPPRRTSSTVSH
jgi:hypothetical protein